VLPSKGRTVALDRVFQDAPNVASGWIIQYTKK